MCWNDIPTSFETICKENNTDKQTCSDTQLQEFLCDHEDEVYNIFKSDAATIKKYLSEILPSMFHPLHISSCIIPYHHCIISPHHSHFFVSHPSILSLSLPPFPYNTSFCSIWAPPWNITPIIFIHKQKNANAIDR